MRDDRIVGAFGGDEDDDCHGTLPQSAFPISKFPYSEFPYGALPQGDDLPPELIALAGQLSDDAAFLAARFPSAPLPAAMPAQVSAAGAVQVSATGAAHTKVTRRFARFPWAAAVLFAALGTGMLATDLISNAPEPAEQVRPVASGAAAVKPVIAFEMFTGAEQEAVLDLLEEEGMEPGSLSI
jgi:hypothetical protein